MGHFTIGGRVENTRCKASDWESETSMRCLVGHGVRGSQRMVVTAGERGGSLSEGWSTDTPRMSAGCRGNREGTGSASVTVHDSSMDQVTYTARGREGHTGCKSTDWESETSVRCQVGHGRMGTRRTVLTAAGARPGSLSRTWSVDVGGLSVLRRGNQASTGSVIFTVSWNPLPDWQDQRGAYSV